MTTGPVRGWRGPIIGWGRPLEEAAPWCGVITISAKEGVRTACWGGWSSSERREYVDGRDRDVDHSGRPLKKCGGCAIAAQIERTNDGLAELAAAPVRMSGVVQFDLSDVGGEDR